MTKEPLVVSIERGDSKICLNAESVKVSIVLDLKFPASASSDFACFMFLPIAMAMGRPLHIAGTVDRTTAENAERMSRIWMTWLPLLFQWVAVTADSYGVTPAGSGTVVLYSGGADSAFNLLTRKQRGEKQSLLTVHGLDYGFAAEKRFDDLIAKTSPFVEYVSDEWITVKTDIYAAYQPLGISSDIGHGFALAACLFLYNHKFKVPEISADCNPAQYMIIHPWGTNPITNPLFASSSFHLQTANTDTTRCEKLIELAKSPIALDSLSFCGKERNRPHNCGRCNKCVRTKAMFLAVTGSEPPIFMSPGIDRKCLSQWKVWDTKESASFLDFYDAAQRYGHIDTKPWFEDVVASFYDRSLLAPIKRGLAAMTPIDKRGYGLTRSTASQSPG